MDKDLEEIRAQMDAVDSRIVEALAERQRLVQDVVAYKAKTGKRVRDPERERAMLTRLATEARAVGLDGYFVTRLFHQVLDQSLRYQQGRLSTPSPEGATADRSIVVAFQGRSGAYSEMAAEQHFGPHGVAIRTDGYDSFAHTLQAVESHKADYGILPVENTTAGSINEAYDLLAHTDLSVVGEEIVHASHCLVALPNATLPQIRRVYSHPQGLLQCSDFIAGLIDCHAEAFTDTAMSVVKVRDDGDPSQAAIASERAATLYGLQVLARDIANQRDNYTRMMVVARQPVHFDSRIPCKTSLIFATAHSEGALLRCLEGLAQHRLNLTKLESRPRPGVAWEYLFYVDFEGSSASAQVQEALASLRPHTSFLKVLGSYPARTTRQGHPADTERALSERLVLHSPRDQTQTLRVGKSAIGGQRPVLIAGPPAAESRAQVMACAKALQAVGADILRAPCFRAQRDLGHFGGAGLPGLAWLEEARRTLGLPVMCNVREGADVSAVAAVADILEVDGDRMQDYALLEKLGKLDRPIMLRRAPDATLETWLASAQHLAAFGNQQVLLCEGGIGGPGGRTVLDLAALSELHQQPFPVITDLTASVLPGGTSPRQAWAAMGRAALQAGAHGLILSVHPDPSAALTEDAALALSDLEGLVRSELGGSPSSVTSAVTVP